MSKNTFVLLSDQDRLSLELLLKKVSIPRKTIRRKSHKQKLHEFADRQLKKLFNI